MSTSDPRNTEAAENDIQDVSIGVRLQLVREQKGLTLQQVSAETHVSPSNLTAVEAENFELLPADIFTRGLVSIYADYLGLDGTETARLFIKERDRHRPQPRKNRIGKRARSLTPKKLAEPSHISSATVAGILLVSIVVTFTAFCLYTGWNPFTYFLELGQTTPTTPLHQ
jgi:cytoskeletal protein RodZ